MGQMRKSANPVTQREQLGVNRTGLSQKEIGTSAGLIRKLKDRKTLETNGWLDYLHTSLFFCCSLIDTRLQKCPLQIFFFKIYSFHMTVERFTVNYVAKIRTMRFVLKLKSRAHLVLGTCPFSIYGGRLKNKKY